MMHDKTRYWFTLVGVFLLHCFIIMSCGEKSNSELLSRAESIMEEHPDSSLLLINSIEHQKLTKEQRALFNLLTTAAVYKTYGLQSDSMVLEAINFYERKKNQERLLQAYYYIGGIHSDNDDVLKAQSYYLKALDYVEGSENYLIIGKLYSNLGALYTWQNLYDYSIPYLKLAVRYSKMASDTKTLAISLRDLGRAYSMLEDIDTASDYYEQSLSVANEKIRISMLCEIAELYAQKGEYETAFLYLQEVLNFNESENDRFSTFISLGSLFMYIGNLDSARYYLKKTLASNENRILQGAYYYLMLTEKSGGDFTEMAKMFDLFWDYYKKYEKEHYSERVIHIDKIYQNNRLEIMNAELKIKKIKQDSIQNTIILILIFVCLFFVSYSIKKNKEIRMQKKRFHDWVDKYQSQKVEKESFEQLVHSSVYRKFHDEKETWQPDSEDWKNLSTLIDATYNNFTYNLKGLYPSVSDFELKISYLIKIGISPGRIASTLNSTVQSITMTRSRLYEKITKEKGSTAKFDELILKL